LKGDLTALFIKRKETYACKNASGEKGAHNRLHVRPAKQPTVESPGEELSEEALSTESRTISLVC